jgi:3-deoxy-manno-octulosonate cytidylyltransferase (CMP-KDO synthetase)
MDRVLVVIPARYGSFRLPGKPLVKIGGMPMVVRTYHNVLAQSLREKRWAWEIMVATDDQRIVEVCEKSSVPVMMTSGAHRTGTDRVAEVADNFPDYDVVINVQGDEPLMAPGSVSAIISAVRATGLVCCGRAKLHNDEIASRNVGKVVCDLTGRALYISRSPIPCVFDLRFQPLWYTQVCVYGFPRHFLLEFAEHPQTPLELVEGIELLRWMEMGHTLQMVSVPGERLSVDVPADVERLNSLLAAREVAGG